MYKLFTVVTALSIFAQPLCARADEPILNDANFAAVDNDADFADLEQRLASDPDFQPGTLIENGEGIDPAAIPKSFLPFEEVMATVSPHLEQKFDMYIIANTAETGSSSELIPKQHIRVFKRKAAGLPVFQRNAAGAITGFQEANLAGIEGLPRLVPTSSGRPGNNGIRTFSGVFRVNVTRSRTNLATSTEAPMSFQTYIDFKYNPSTESGIAVHGTPSRFRGLLGKQRASHGCLRVDPANARLIRAAWFRDPAMFADDVPAFDVYDNLPSEAVRNGSSGTRPGVKVLFIIFNGFKNPTLDAKATTPARALSSK